MKVGILELYRTLNTENLIKKVSKSECNTFEQVITTHFITGLKCCDMTSMSTQNMSIIVNFFCRFKIVLI